LIGIFDSGFGGLSVMREIIKVFPHTSIVYFGDSAHLPYGTKSEKAVKRFSLKILDFLLKKKVKLVVVACHTASSFALNNLRRKSKVPVIGMIEPSVDRVVKDGFKRVGIIGTTGTINSKSYFYGLKKKKENLKILDKACPLFVPLVEEGLTEHRITEDVINMYLKSMKGKIDALILGCTHYPLLKKGIKKVLGGKIKLIDPGREVAECLKEKYYKVFLKKKKVRYYFYTSDAPEKFKIMGGMFLGRKIDKVYLSKCTE